MTALVPSRKNNPAILTRSRGAAARPLCVSLTAAQMWLCSFAGAARADVFVDHGIRIAPRVVPSVVPPGTGLPENARAAKAAGVSRIRTHSGSEGEVATAATVSAPVAVPFFAHIDADSLASLLLVDRRAGIVRVLGANEPGPTDEGAEGKTPSTASAEPALVERARFSFHEGKENAPSSKARSRGRTRRKAGRHRQRVARSEPLGSLAGAVAIPVSDKGTVAEGSIATSPAESSSGPAPAPPSGSAPETAIEVLAAKEVRETRGPQGEADSRREILAWSVSAPEETAFVARRVRKGRRSRTVRSPRTTRLSAPRALFGEEGSRARFLLAHGDLAALAQFVLPARTPIAVVPAGVTLSLVPAPAARLATLGVLNGIERWRGAWESADFTTYSSSYSSAFSSLGRNARFWLAQKRSTARAEPEGRAVNLSEPQVVGVGSHVYVSFLQRYVGGRRRDFGFKSLALERSLPAEDASIPDSPSWSIAAEHWRAGADETLLALVDPRDRAGARPRAARPATKE